MTLKGILDTSIIISLLERSCRGHGWIQQKIKICFRYSFLGKVSETEQVSPVVLDDSRVVRYLINLYRQYKGKAIQYLGHSISLDIAKDTAKDTKEQFSSSPVRIISIILVTAILVNAVLTVILQRQMELWSFLIQVLFLFAGAAGLSCQADWPTVKKSSAFLRKLRIG